MAFDRIEYLKQYRKEHKEQLNSYNREWRKRNPLKTKLQREKQKLNQIIWRERNQEKLKQYHKEYAKNHRKKFSDSSRKFTQKLRMEVLRNYSPQLKCACCGEKILEFLTIDHIYNNGNKHRKKGLRGSVFYRWLKNNHYPPNYQILCMNCNFAKGKYGKCPHEKIITNMDGD